MGPGTVPRAWVQQARADLDAALSTGAGARECHRRYWLQQACEKGIKALGLVLWSGDAGDEGQLRAMFLLRHDPLKRLQGEPELPRSLRLLLRQLEAELAGIDNAGLLLQVDATTATTTFTDPSYRYPFVDGSGALVTPASWTTTEWDAYQGNEMGVRRAIGRLLDVVEDRIRKSRGPR